MEYVFLIIGIVLVILAAALVVIDRIKTRRLIEDLTDLIDSAIKGEVIENRFDESVQSQLEYKLREYIESSSLSARKVEEEKDKIKALISDISHQTKTPIANLMLYSELLGEEELPDNIREQVGAIRSQSEKLKFLIDSLVKMSRLENGILTLYPSETSSRELTDSICEDLKAKADAKGLKLSADEDDHKLMCDPKWTYEAIFNIVDNAIKYTDEGEVRITVSEYEMFARIDVIDTGIGMSEEDRSKVFGRFYRGENARDKEGVGIGLFLTREIITAENGYIKVSGNPEGGTCFSIFLPRA